MRKHRPARRSSINPLTAPARKFSGLKSVHIHAANSTFDGPITILLSVLCILVEVLSRAQAKSGKSLNDFKFGTSIGRFPSDGAASTAVKGLMGFKINLFRAWRASTTTRTSASW